MSYRWLIVQLSDDMEKMDELATHYRRKCEIIEQLVNELSKMWMSLRNDEKLDPDRVEHMRLIVDTWKGTT